MTEGKKMKLVLEDGTEFTGTSFGSHRSISGEVVFNTAMTGYPESLTDPSYKGQILVLTYPLIGNYGVPDESLEENMFKHFESDRLHISGLIVSDYSVEYSHWNAKRSLGDWLKQHEIPGIFGIDTRQLTKILVFQLFSQVAYLFLQYYFSNEWRNHYHKYHYEPRNRN